MKEEEQERLRQLVTLEEAVKEQCRPLTFEEAIHGWLAESRWCPLYSPLPKSYSSAEAECEHDDRGSLKRGWLLVERAILAVTGHAHRRESLERLIVHEYAPTPAKGAFRLFPPGVAFQEEIRALGFTPEWLCQKALKRFRVALEEVVKGQ